MDANSMPHDRSQMAGKVRSGRTLWRRARELVMPEFHQHVMENLMSGFWSTLTSTTGMSLLKAMRIGRPTDGSTTSGGDDADDGAGAAVPVDEDSFSGSGGSERIPTKPPSAPPVAPPPPEVREAFWGRSALAASKLKAGSPEALRPPVRALSERARALLKERESERQADARPPAAMLQPGAGAVQWAASQSLPAPSTAQRGQAQQPFSGLSVHPVPGRGGGGDDGAGAAFSSITSTSSARRSLSHGAALGAVKIAPDGSLSGAAELQRQETWLRWRPGEVPAQQRIGRTSLSVPEAQPPAPGQFAAALGAAGAPGAAAPPTGPGAAPLAPFPAQQPPFDAAAAPLFGAAVPPQFAQARFAPVQQPQPQQQQSRKTTAETVALPFEATAGGRSQAAAAAPPPAAAGGAVNLRHENAVSVQQAHQLGNLDLPSPHGAAPAPQLYGALQTVLGLPTELQSRRSGLLLTQPVSHRFGAPLGGSKGPSRATSPGLGVPPHDASRSPSVDVAAANMSQWPDVALMQQGPGSHSSPMQHSSGQASPRLQHSPGQSPGHMSPQLHPAPGLALPGRAPMPGQFSPQQVPPLGHNGAGYHPGSPSSGQSAGRTPFR